MMPTQRSVQLILEVDGEVTAKARTQMLREPLLLLRVSRHFSDHVFFSSQLDSPIKLCGDSETEREREGERGRDGEC